MTQYRMRRALAVFGLLVLGIFTLGASPALLDLIARTEIIEQFLFSEPVETILLDDDFEDGIDPAWVQVYGTTQTIVPTGDCTQAYWSRYASCGSLGLHFDEKERYDYQPPVPVAGYFSLYFHDNPADTSAAAWIGILGPGGQERLGVETSICPDTYYISLNAGSHRCTIIPRRLGWHRVEFVRTGTTSKGYFDHILLYETNHSDRAVIKTVTVMQEVAGRELSGFAIDDVRFVAFE